MIAIENLCLDLSGQPILRSVSLSIAPGEVTGLVGESGSGKSMTALAMMRLLPPGAQTSGRIDFDGRDILSLSEVALCDMRGNEIGMIFQEPMTALNPVQSIGAQVAETLTIHGQASRATAWARARECLDRVGLQDISAERFPHELSGGQRQRVCIAAAIALRPKLLIADEPSTALDVTTQAQILDLLKGLVDEDGMALLLITHDLGVIAQLAARVAVMKDGEIVEQGPTEEVLSARLHAYTRQLFAASTHQPARRSRPSGEVLLKAENVSQSYPGQRRGLLRRDPPVEAVKSVSFELCAGESLGLVGGSGCGKSTLARALMGLDRVTGGRITLAGQPVSPSMSPEARSAIQIVFQDPFGSFDPRWRVARLVAEPFHLSPHRRDLAHQRARVAEVLDAVQLSASDMEKYPHEFSGGQRQRIAIARALVLDPDILVLDEAVSALDVSVRAGILDLLAELQASRGLSFLFISHDLTVVRAITDRVLVMQAGEIVEEGKTAEVFAAPKAAYTRALIAAAPRLDRVAEAV
ncbi:MAG: ABC transporter ATP-binding protein [Pseudomonadota bacterium]